MLRWCRPGTNDYFDSNISNCYRTCCYGGWLLQITWVENTTLSLFIINYWYHRIFFNSNSLRNLADIWWDDAQYHEVDCCVRCPCFANLWAFHGTLKFSMIGLDQVWRMMTHIKKGGNHTMACDLVVCIMKWITIWKDHTQPVFTCSDHGRGCCRSLRFVLHNYREHTVTLKLLIVYPIFSLSYKWQLLGIAFYAVTIVWIIDAKEPWKSIGNAS